MVAGRALGKHGTGMDQGAPLSRPGGPGRPQTDQTAAWVQRLFGQRGLRPDERRLFWYGQHLERFLRWRGGGEPTEAGTVGARVHRWRDPSSPLGG